MRRSVFRFILVIMGVVLIGSCGGKKSTIQREQILGSWKTIIGDNEYVQFEKMDSEYVYSAYTYDRLAASGTWEIEGDNLTLNYDDGSSTIMATRLNGDTLIFNGGAEKYVRAVIAGDGKTPLVDIGDVEILESIIKTIKVVFSEAEPFNEDWVDSKIKWQKITTDVILKNEGLTEVVDIANQISKYLVAQRFDIDKSKTSEKIMAYKKGTLCVLVRIRSSNAPEAGETAFVDVISGVENR
jgi:hypothetical protein